MCEFYKCENGNVIPVLEYNNERVLPARSICKIHNTDKSVVCKKFRQNADIFEAGIDYYQLSPKEARDYHREMEGKTTGYAKGEKLYTRKGYELLMSKDTEVMQKIIREYFEKQAKEIKINKAENVSRETDVRIEKEEEKHEYVDQTKREIEKKQLEPEVAEPEAGKAFEALLEIAKASFANQNRLMDLIEKQYETINKLLGIDNTEFVPESEEIVPQKTPEDNKSKVEEFPTYVEWKRRITHACKLVVNLKGNYESVNSVLSASYGAMKNRYGICWTQEYKETPKSDGEKVSTLSIAYNVELKNRNCRNLLLAVIKDIYEEEKRNNKATA